MFELVSKYKPCGDQPLAIQHIAEGFNAGISNITLLGVTGSGKTFTMANVIKKLGKPALIIAPNKTLAAQLFAELKGFFPNNAVEYFVSYYDYYQPEAYIPQSDTYIQKDSNINEQIDKMRHSATRALLDREDVIIVASVSCIYGLGSPETYYDMLLYAEKGMGISRDDVIEKLVDMQYERSEMDFQRGKFRVRGDLLDIFPAHEEERAVRICFFGDNIEDIYIIDPLTSRIIEALSKIAVYPASHYVTTSLIREQAISLIKSELKGQIESFRHAGKSIEAQRIEERTRFDLEMMIEAGYCHGIENYSRHLTGRAQGEPPPTLIDYFPEDFLCIIDESHMTIPQIRGMFRGDRSRKETLVKYGFRLPSALDNRPLNFQEFEEKINRILYVSATPGPYEVEKSSLIVEQLVRPTGLLDPVIEVRPALNQIDDLLHFISEVTLRGERVLVTTLTKRMAEDLTDYYGELGIKVQYMHSEINTLERIDIIKDLRMGVFDVLIGINLLREGLDLPEVSLVAVLDADKEGFLRSERSLIQTCGRAARNVNGRVILYGDSITESMKLAINESERRRSFQMAYNEKHGIIPKSIKKEVEYSMFLESSDTYVKTFAVAEESAPYMSIDELLLKIEDLENKMRNAAADLRFEEAIGFRDQINTLNAMKLYLS